MARHRHAVIWTRVSGQPEKMGDLVLTDTEAALTCTPAYLASGRPGFCLLGDGAIWGADTVTYPVSERIPVFPRLLALIPGNNPRNLQRRHYLDLLRARDGREPPPGPETEWRLLLLGGHGGIGHVDVFPDDIGAEAWYRSTLGAARSGGANPQPGPAESGSQLWRMLKRQVLDESTDFDPRLIDLALGPTPSVGGMIPKLLLSLDPLDPAPRFYPPDAEGKRNVVLKVEPPEYRGLLDLEALCLDIHRQAGFETPACHRLDDGELHFLAVERFDRRDGAPIPMESLFSIIATGNHQFRETGDVLLEELGEIIRRLSQVAGLDPGTGEALYRHILMALLTGNGDLHLDNLALIGGLSACRLAPVYDPAPMRAWPRHDLVSAIPFDPEGYAHRGHFFVALGSTFGLSDGRVRSCVEDALEATADYGERVQALQRVPARQRERLEDIWQRERVLLSRGLNAS